MASGGTTTSSGGGLADRYATALYSLADDRRELDATVVQMEGLGKLIAESPEFRRLIDSPLIDTATARRAAEAVLQAEGFGPILQNFVGVVANNRRLGALPQIVRAFAALVARKRGVIMARVSSAHPLNDLQRQQLRARLIEAGYGNVDIQEEVDKSLLGGLVVKIGARLYDTSLKSRLQRLQHAMKGAA